jgi:hypothetical protein
MYMENRCQAVDGMRRWLQSSSSASRLLMIVGTSYASVPPAHMAVRLNLPRFWILDFGFWIRRQTPIQNPKSKIQNRIKS